MLNRNGWPEWKRLVLAQLEQHEVTLQEIHKEVKLLRDATRAVETRMAIVATMAGFLASLVVAAAVRWLH